MIFLFLFILIPLIELYFMLEVGDQIGALNTVLLVVLTAVIGGLLVRMQGFSTMLKVRSAMERGEAPALEMIEGAILLLCGLMLLLPGFVTDAIGFVLLVPPLRRLFVLKALSRARVLGPGKPLHPRQESNSHRVIEADDWKREDDH